ncbi:hypothetical protein [Stieleria varia]|nr:hypothetical protein [Stieleria varia]
MHTIRLRGPWKKIPLGENQPIRVTIPETAAASGSGATYQRSFNCPTGIDQSRVQVDIESWDGSMIGILLNEISLTLPSQPISCPLSFDVTDHLQPHNTLVIELQPKEKEHGCVGLTGEVSLKIAPSP